MLVIFSLVVLSTGASAFAVPVTHNSYESALAGGNTKSFRSEDGFGNYNFGYDEDHTEGGTFRRESGNSDGVKEGSYGLRDADGRVRVVNYVADQDGFRASITSNEPGVGNASPADVSINGNPTAHSESPTANSVPYRQRYEPIIDVHQNKVYPHHSGYVYNPRVGSHAAYADTNYYFNRNNNNNYASSYEYQAPWGSMHHYWGHRA